MYHVYPYHPHPSSSVPKNQQPARYKNYQRKRYARTPPAIQTKPAPSLPFNSFARALARGFKDERRKQ
jgi:hypothetical protein